MCFKLDGVTRSNVFFKKSQTRLIRIWKWQIIMKRRWYTLKSSIFITFGAIWLLGFFLVFSVLSSVSSISKTVFVGLEKIDSKWLLMFFIYSCQWDGHFLVCSIPTAVWRVPRIGLRRDKNWFRPRRGFFSPSIR